MSMHIKYKIQDLNLHYGQFHALKDINLELPEKKITAFIGPSGCGKSTLLKTLNRMNDLVEGCKIDGTVLLDGEDIFGNMDVNVLRRRVGMVFQKPNPFPMSIYDNIAFGPRTHGIHKKAVLDEIVEKSLRSAQSGTRSRTDWTRAHWACPADSSRDCALRARSPSSRKCC